MTKVKKPEQKAERREVRATRQAAKQQRKEQAQAPREDFSQAAVRIVREATDKV